MIVVITIVQGMMMEMEGPITAMGVSLLVVDILIAEDTQS